MRCLKVCNKRKLYDEWVGLVQDLLYGTEMGWGLKRLLSAVNVIVPAFIRPHPIPRFWKLFLRLSYTITPKSLLHAEHISRYFAKHFAFVAQKFMKIWLILSRCSEASRSIKGLLMEKWIIKHFCLALLAAFELIELQPSCELRCSIHYRNTYTLLSIRYCGQGASSHPQSHKVSLQSLGNYGGFSPLNIFIR